LSLSYTIPGGHAFTNIDVGLTYWSSTAKPRAILELSASSIPMTPTYMKWQINTPGSTKQWIFNGPTKPFSISYIWQADTLNSNLTTGLYSYGYIISDIFMPGVYRYRPDVDENLVVRYSTPTEKKSYFYGFQTVINRTKSPYGSGWAIDGVTQLIRKKGSFSGNYPHNSAIISVVDNKPVSLEDTTFHIPSGMSYKLALGNTRGSADGNHVSIIGSGMEGTIYWYNQKTDKYDPPEGSYDSLSYDGDAWIRKLQNGSIEIYSNDGLLRKKIDRKGNKSIYSYDAFGVRLLKITDEKSGKSSELKYDNKDNLCAVVDQFGRTTNIQIDDKGDLVAIETPDNIMVRQYKYKDHLAIEKDLINGNNSRYYYNMYGSIDSTKSPSGLRTVYVRAGESNIANSKSELVDSLSAYQSYRNRQEEICTQMQIDIDSVAQYCYTIDVPFVYKPISTYNILAYSNDNEYSSNNQNNAYSFYDQLGRSKEYVFNNQGNIISETNVKGDKIQYIYNESSCNCGSAASIKYPNGLIIEKEYDIKGNLTKVFNTFTKATTKYAYHTIKGIDVVDTITNALGQQTIYGYDTLSNLISIMEPDGNISYISYNNQSLPVTFTDQQGNISRTIYDSLGQAIASINPKGDSTIYDYDEFGNIRTITDPQGRSINYNYDIMDRMISETDAAGNITRYSYNNMSELDSLIDPMGHVTTFNYDAGGNLIKTTNHFGISRNYNYDEQGKLISYENARGQQILYQYDNLGQLLRKSTQEDSTIARYGYDNMGNMTIAANKNISINRFYDLSGRLVSESQSILKLNDTLSDNDTISADDFSKDYSNLVINGDTVIIDGEHHYLSISLINGAVVKHLATDLDFVHKCNITARDFIWVDTDSKIDVTGLGYLGGGRDGNDTTLGRTKGNSLTEGSTPGSGGSHGGKGGAFTFGSSTIGLSARTYDDKLWPTYPGSGGGSNGNPGFNGGGVIYLDAPRIIVDGNLVANGEDALNDNGGAGAGGSIIVKADSLLGSGEIKANGGNGIEGYEKPRGGGGGRILISANIITPVIKFPFGGLCGGSCGSLWYKNTFGYYVLESVFQGDSIHKIDYQDTIYNNSNIIVDGTTLIINGQHAFKSIKIISGGVLSHDNPNEDTNCLGSILRVSNQIDIDPSSRIDLVGKGYAGSIGNLCAQTINRQCGATGLSGGSYGGKGADLNGSSGDEYGDPHNPHELGSGGAQLNGNIESKGGNGGGHITIFCPKINLNGNIIANGSLGLLGGAGSGGSIIIHTDTILGMGEIKADGGSYNYPGQPFTGGGGGGGRIAIFTRDNNTLNLNKIHARGGYGAKNGLPGTIYLSANDSLIREYNKYPTVIYKDTTISLTASDKHLDSTSITLDGSYLTIQGKHSFENLTVSNWSTIEMNDSLSVNVLKILDNGYITQSYPTITNDSIKTYAMHIIAKEIYIEEYGILWATGSGYPGGWPQIDSQITLSPFVGGSHGGNGGGWYKGWLCDSNEAQFTGCSIGESGTIFDSYKFPNLPGGGGGNKAEPGCSGGGIIDLKCDLLYNKGKIFADGNMQFNIDNPKGAGAGGSILIRSSKIMGNGIYSAIGGLVYIYDRGRPPLARSGGGGRIAIHCPEIPSNLIDNLFVNSGKCNQYRLGTGAGTG
jgi:YD repeat-containing protein